MFKLLLTATTLLALTCGAEASVSITGGGGSIAHVSARTTKGFNNTKSSEDRNNVFSGIPIENPQIAEANLETSAGFSGAASAILAQDNNEFFAAQSLTLDTSNIPSNWSIDHVGARADSTVGGYVHDDTPQGQGKIRFVIDYDLSNSNMAYLNFRANIYSLVNYCGYVCVGSESTSFSASNYSNPVSTWTSDWFNYDRQIPFFSNAEFNFDLTSSIDSYNGYSREEALSQVWAKLRIETIAAPIPEPETYALFALGIIAIATTRKLTKQ